MRYLQKEAPKELLDTLRVIETQSDECFKGLRLLRMPRNQAVWTVLTNAVSRIEAEIAQYGDNSSRFDVLLINLSRLCTLEVEWIAKYGKPASKLISKWNWSAVCQTSAEEALQVANNYDGFLACFPMWHKDRCLAEALNQTGARFTAVGDDRERQVSAYQKGFRPGAGRFKSARAAKPEQQHELQQLFSTVLQTCEDKGKHRFLYPDPTELWSALLPEYRTRVEGICRRADSIDLGEYTLADFKRFYVGLLAVCAAHEHLCYRWLQAGNEFPLDSAIMIKPRRRWARILAVITGLTARKSDCMVHDLTLGVTRSVNLHVHPFVPMDAHSETLALAPQFPLHSCIDENILQTCSRLRPSVYDAATLEKEEEMRSTLKEASRFRVEGPATLPKALPDVDLIVEDLPSSTVVIAEMKWARKPTRPIESLDRDSDVLKGIRQLGLIKGFLHENPDHLHAQGKLTNSLEGYQHVHFLLIARDHWLWIDTNDHVAIIEFDPFLRILQNAEDLHIGIADLLTYDWLPVEGRDFVVRYERSIANGVVIESQVFHPLGP